MEVKLAAVDRDPAFRTSVCSQLCLQFALAFVSLGRGREGGESEYPVVLWL